MSTKQHKKPWYISLREHLIDPMVRSTAPGSIGRLFSTATFGMCCRYWLSTSPNPMDHEAPSSLLQVFYWTTGYVLANTIVKTTSGHITERVRAIVPDIPTMGPMGAQGSQQTSTRQGVYQQTQYGGYQPNSNMNPGYTAPTQSNNQTMPTSPVAPAAKVPVAQAPSTAAKTVALSQESGHTVVDSDIG